MARTTSLRRPVRSPTSSRAPMPGGRSRRLRPLRFATDSGTTKPVQQNGGVSKEARRYAGQSADERDQERLSRLRSAALELFGTDGYAAVPVERLCSEAKVSTRHYYQLFANKEAALVDLYTDITSASVVNVGVALAATEG